MNRNASGEMINADDLAKLDHQFESHVIKSFIKTDYGYELTFDSGWSFFMPDVGFAPEVGNVAKLYGCGIGHCVRGLVVKDRVVFYRTSLQQDELNRKECEQREADKRTAYDKREEEYNLRVSALPQPFIDRIAGFRNYKPATWKYDYEPYELFVCEQAVEIASAMKTPEETKRFHELEFVEQKKLVPGLSDQHSGNTFGAACLLARLFVTRPDLVEKAHGALCPLVGCKDYGCYASRCENAVTKC